MDALQKKLSHLAALRRDATLAKVQLESLLDAFEARPDVRHLRQALSDLTAQIDELTHTVKDEALAAFQATGNKRPYTGVQIKDYSVMAYDVEAARTWDFEHLPDALVLNGNLFEKVARQLDKEKRPIPFVTISVDPRPTLATDLSAYLAGAGGLDAALVSETVEQPAGQTNP